MPPSRARHQPATPAGGAHLGPEIEEGRRGGVVGVGEEVGGVVHLVCEPLKHLAAQMRKWCNFSNAFDSRCFSAWLCRMCLNYYGQCFTHCCFDLFSPDSLSCVWRNVWCTRQNITVYLYALFLKIVDSYSWVQRWIWCINTCTASMDCDWIITGNSRLICAVFPYKTLQAQRRRTTKNTQIHGTNGETLNVQTLQILQMPNTHGEREKLQIHTRKCVRPPGESAWEISAERSPPSLKKKKRKATHTQKTSKGCAKHSW